jgi:RNA polymerase sigma-70 factor (ECF subfamily)
MKYDKSMSSFEEIYDEYHQMIFRSAYLVTGNRYDAEDIMQDTFVIVYENLDQLRRKESLKPWMFRIMTNVIHRRARKAARETPDEEITDRVDGLELRNASGKSSLDALPQRLDVLRDLEGLKPEQREAVVLFYYGGLSIREIAKAAGCLEGTVKSRLSLGRKALKEKMLHEDETQAVKKKMLHEEKMQSVKEECIYVEGR